MYSHLAIVHLCNQPMNQPGSHIGSSIGRVTLVRCDVPIKYHVHVYVEMKFSETDNQDIIAAFCRYVVSCAWFPSCLNIFYLSFFYVSV